MLPGFFFDMEECQRCGSGDSSERRFPIGFGFESKTRHVMYWQLLVGPEAECNSALRHFAAVFN
jgi:hypothetical protein